MLTPPPKLSSIPFQSNWIVYEDQDLLIINKPSGLLSVPGRTAPPDWNLLSQVQNYAPDALIVHRLDMDTSGLMVLARNRQSHRALSRQFQDRLTVKRYQAICFGKPSQLHGKVQLPMRCDWENRPSQIIDCRQGKSATTYWQVTQSLPNAFEVILTPITGRSHQLRLHMKMLGHPILGDNLYAPQQALQAANRLLLHAQELHIFHPSTQKALQFKEPLDLTTFLNGMNSA
ncbi:RNA pseudouridine synthase [Hydrogenovibrio sp. SC-1]|uniref:RluA family pseudouridine synthase n=1 Tax=Hydrogenovibrio sp. SC-1 TaxID=2065820 RepID=UPI000C795C9D|nr:RluA family pseudouridine synthase [Hydrogenovibrio sp. SC-1]PLA75598.1 RNA pseudouridine synthase [Hydrogenovibrio sp. SC-1]